MRCKMLIGFNLRNSIREFISLKKSWIRQYHSTKLNIMVIIFILLILCVTFFYIIILGNEEAVTYISFEGDAEKFVMTDNSYVRIRYIPDGNDEITYHLELRNLNESKEGQFSLAYNGKIKKGKSFSFGVEESHNYLNTHYYSVDFNNSNFAYFDQTFYCNLFKDKMGDVRLNLDLGNIDNINVNFLGLDNFKLHYTFPKPKEQYPHLLIYTYNYDRHDYFNGIYIEGNNPSIERKVKKIEFFFGVVIAILVSSLVAIGVEVFKEKY